MCMMTIDISFRSFFLSRHDFTARRIIFSIPGSESVYKPLHCVCRIYINRNSMNNFPYSRPDYGNKMDIRSLILLYYLLNNTIYSTALITSVVTVTVTAQQQQPQQTQASASSLSSSSSSYTNKTQLQHDTLTQTNSYRQQHNASALKWNISLAIYAQNWADRCLWKHSVRLSPLSPAVLVR